MFENIIHQEATESLSSDIKNNTFPHSVLLSGPSSSGKLTTALEIARVLSCENNGKWQCSCPSCKRSKSLIKESIMLMGPRDCLLEIAASKDALLKALLNEALYLDATRYLFLRAVRKLAMRFNPILWDGDVNLSKVGTLTASIEDLMETVDYPAKLSNVPNVEKTVNKIEELCQKLETTLLYDTIPVRQVRNMAFWSRLKAESGKKTVIIEAADKMLESVRNSLLKILEEPPEDTFFILTTSRRAAVMSTILSRVRTYTLRERTAAEQSEVLSRVFHVSADKDMTINDYLNTFLPVNPSIVRGEARKYVECVVRSRFPDAASIAKTCASFKPRVLLTVFMEEMAKALTSLFGNAVFSEAAARSFDAIRGCALSINTYNISAAAALESLFASLCRINKSCEGAFSATARENV